MSALLLTEDFIAWAEERGYDLDRLSPPVAWGLVALYEREQAIEADVWA